MTDQPDPHLARFTGPAFSPLPVPPSEALPQDPPPSAAPRYSAVDRASDDLCGPCRRGQHAYCDGGSYVGCSCTHGLAVDEAAVKARVRAQIAAELVPLLIAHHWSNGSGCGDECPWLPDDGPRLIAEQHAEHVAAIARGDV